MRSQRSTCILKYVKKCKLNDLLKSIQISLKSDKNNARQTFENKSCLKYIGELKKKPNLSKSMTPYFD